MYSNFKFQFYKISSVFLCHHNGNEKNTPSLSIAFIQNNNNQYYSIIGL